MKLWALALFVLMGCNSADSSTRASTSAGVPFKVGDELVVAKLHESNAEKCTNARLAKPQKGILGQPKVESLFKVRKTRGDWMQVENVNHGKDLIWVKPGLFGYIICPK